jgi:hypothetical protein
MCRGNSAERSLGAPLAGGQPRFEHRPQPLLSH